MLSLGWSEIFILVSIVILVIGPKELPTVIKKIGYFSKKFKSVSRDFNTSLNNLIKETEIEEVKKSIKDISKVDLTDNKIKDEFNNINSSFNKLDKNIKNLDKKLSKDNKK